MLVDGKRGPCKWDEDILGGDFVGSLGDSALGDLEGLLNLVLDGLLLLLNGRAEGLGAGSEVTGEVGVGGEAGAVLGDEVIEGSLEVALLEVLVAVERRWLACFGDLRDAIARRMRPVLGCARRRGKLAGWSHRIAAGRVRWGGQGIGWLERQASKCIQLAKRSLLRAEQPGCNATAG